MSDTPIVFTTLDNLFFNAGYTGAIRQHGIDKVALVANANRVDHFTLWVAKAIERGILDELDTADDAQCSWFDNYCKQCKPSTSYNPFVIDIAHRIYREFRDPAEPVKE